MIINQDICRLKKSLRSLFMKKDVQNQPNQKYKGFWRYMKKYIAPYSKKLLLSAIGSAIVGIFVSIQPLVIKWIVDDGISNNALASIDKVKFIAMLCGFYILLSIGRIFIYKAAFINMLKSLEGALFNLRSHFFSHVQHLVSHVTGKLKNNLDAIDAFTSLFPAGTLSGAPKIRAMEIINQNEKYLALEFGTALPMCKSGF